NFFRKVILHFVGNIMAIIVYLRYARTGKVSAVISNYSLPHIFIITIEDECEVIVKQFVSGFVRFQYKFLKKPSGVAQMPFWGRNIYNGLDHVVFNFQWLANIFGMLAGFEK